MKEENYSNHLIDFEHQMTLTFKMQTSESSFLALFKRMEGAFNMTQNNSDPVLDGMSMASNNIVKSWMKKKSTRFKQQIHKIYRQFTEHVHILCVSLWLSE